MLEHLINTGAVKKGGTTKNMEVMDTQIFKAEFAAVRESFMKCMMLSGTNKDRYGGLKAKLKNAQLLGRKNSPKTWENLMGILNNFKDEKKTTTYDKPFDLEKVEFSKNGEVVGQAKPEAAPAAVAYGVKMNKAGKSACH